MRQILLGTAALAVIVGLFMQASKPEVIVFKDGRELEVEHFELRGESVIFATADGRLRAVPSDEVDILVTAQANRLSHLGLATAQASVLPAQDAQGTMVVTSDGNPTANIDVFVLVNQGKQPLGTTNTMGQLPFDPALLTGKVRVSVAVMECPQQTEIYLVSIQSGDACQAATEASEEPDCSCELAGAILWGSSIGVDVTALTSSGASSLATNPLLWGGIGAGVVTGVVIGTGGSEDGTVPTTTTPQTPSAMVPVPTTAPVAMPEPTPSPPSPQTNFNGTYGFNVIQVQDPGGHISYVIVPNAIEVFVANNGAFRATGAQDFLRMNGNLNRSSGDFNASGQGRINGFAVRATFDGRIDPRPPYRITGSYRVGVNGGFPGGRAVTFRIDDVMR